MLALSRRDESAASRALGYVGRPTELAVRSTLEAVEVVADLREDLLEILRTSATDTEALGRIEEYVRKRPRHDGLAGLIFRTMAKGQLGGHLFVRDVEANTAELDIKLDIESPPATFLNLPFREAIVFAEARGLVDDEGVSDLLGRYRTRGIEASELAVRTVQQRTAKQITRFVSNGGTLRGFVAAVEADGKQLGIGPRDHAYIENVFRTSVQTAYGAGRLEGLRDEVVVDALPARIYRTVGDDRVRDDHAALEGMTWDARETDEWSNVAPPNGYQCRCSMVSGTADEIGAPPQIPSDITIDFFGPPTLAVDEPLL